MVQIAYRMSVQRLHPASYVPNPVDVGTSAPTLTQRITGWMHPTNPYNVPYVVASNQTQLILHPGPNQEVPVVQWTNLDSDGLCVFNVVLNNDSQPDSNFLNIVHNGVVIASRAQNVPYTDTVYLAVYDVIEFQLTGPSYSGGGNILSGTMQRGSTYSIGGAFYANLGAQTPMWKYFYRARTGEPVGTPNSAGPMVAVYGPI